MSADDAAGHQDTTGTRSQSGPRPAGWLLSEAQQLLQERVTTADAARAHTLAVEGLTLVDPNSRSHLLEVAIATSLLLALEDFTFEAEYESWVQECDLLGPTRPLAALPARLARVLVEDQPGGNGLRQDLAHYQAMLVAGWESVIVPGGPSNQLQLIHDLSFYLSSILVFDAAGLPAALLSARRVAATRLTPLGAAPGVAAIEARQALLTDNLALLEAEEVEGEAWMSALVLELSSLLAHAERGNRAGASSDSGFRSLMISMSTALKQLHHPMAARLQLEVARQVRMLAVRERKAEDLAWVSELLESLREDPAFDDDELSSDLMRMRADEYELTGHVNSVIAANDLANALLNAQSDRLNDAETLSGLSLVRFLRYLALGHLADLEEAYHFNELGRQVDGVSLGLRREMLLNGGAIRRHVYEHSHDPDRAREALRDYQELLGLTSAAGGREYRSTLQNIVALYLSADELLEEAGNWDALESSARQLALLANGEPRYLISAAQALLERDGSPDEFTLKALDLILEALCVTTDDRDVVLSLSSIARCITRLSEWAGPDAWIFRLAATASARKVGADLQMDAASTLVGSIKEDDPSVEMKALAYRLFVQSARRLLAVQVSGAERRHRLRVLDGFSSAVLSALAPEDAESAVELAEAGRVLVGLESLALLTHDARQGGDAVRTALDELRAARLAADFSEDPVEIHAARLQIQGAQQQLRDLGFPAAMSPLATSAPADFDVLQRHAGEAPTCYLGIHNGDVVAVTMSRTSSPREVLRAEAGDLTAAANRFIAAYGDRRSDFAGWASAVRSIGEVLWDIIVGPLTNSAGVDHAMTLVTCGSLSLLPFHLAWWQDGTARRHLVEDVEVQTSPGLTFAARAGTPRRAADLGLVGISSSGSSRELPWLKAEESCIRTSFAGKQEVLWATDESSDELLNYAARARYLHIAAHGEARLHAEDAGYLEVGDGRLDEPTILGRRLETLELVVLSACDSGRIDLTLPDEMRGLPLAFLAAGAQAVVGTAWPCDDFVSSWLMAEFYDCLARGARPSLALRTAQTRIRKGAPVAASDEMLHHLDGPWRDVYSHEVYWGAFFVMSATAL